MSFFNTRAPPTSPPINGGSVPTPTTIIISQPQYSSRSTQADVISDSYSSSPSTSPSTPIIIVIIVIASAVIVSATIYLLLRLLYRRCRSTFRTFSSTSSMAPDNVVLPNNLRFSDRTEDRRALHHSVLESLPLFTFGSINGGNFTSGDCAVCLSKFEPQDQLRLLPLCCHAFHASCIGQWLASNLTCPLCRSTVSPTDRDILNKILTYGNPENNGNINGGSMSRSGSFRVEIGSVSRRRDAGYDRRTYAVGTFDYIVDDACEVPIGSIYHRDVSDCTSVDKESVNIQVTGPPGENVAVDVDGSRSWLREYVERISSFSFSSRTMSFRSSGRFFSGSCRRSEVVVPVDDMDACRQGEEISEFFRWLSPV